MDEWLKGQHEKIIEALEIAPDLQYKYLNEFLAERVNEIEKAINDHHLRAEGGANVQKY